MNDRVPLDKSFTDVIEAASEEQRSRGHLNLETPHLLLGILRQKNAKAVQLMASHGFSYEAIRETFDALILARQPSMPSGNVAGFMSMFSPAASSVLGTARREAPGRRVRMVDLLAALLAQRDSLSTGFLEFVASKRVTGGGPLDLSELEREVRELGQEEGGSDTSSS